MAFLPEADDQLYRGPHSSLWRTPSAGRRQWRYKYNVFDDDDVAIYIAFHLERDDAYKVKQSGVGREMGIDALNPYSEVKSVRIRHGA